MLIVSEVLAHVIDVFNAVDIVVEHTVRVVIRGQPVVENADVLQNYFAQATLEQFIVSGLSKINWIQTCRRDHRESTLHPVTKSKLPRFFAGVDVVGRETYDNRIWIPRLALGICVL